MITCLALFVNWRLTTSSFKSHTLLVNSLLLVSPSTQEPSNNHPRVHDRIYVHGVHESHDGSGVHCVHNGIYVHCVHGVHEVYDGSGVHCVHSGSGVHCVHEGSDVHCVHGDNAVFDVYVSVYVCAQIFCEDNDVC